LFTAAAALCLLCASCAQSHTPAGYVDKAKCPPVTRSKLLVELPEICPTPDGMAVAPDGALIVACPNYGDQSHPAVLMRIGRDGQARLHARVPTHPDTSVACPMGIAYGPDGDLFVCDNQGWVKANDKGRILRLRIRNGQVVKTTVVADGMAHPNGVRVRNGMVYVTQSMMPKVESRQLVSAVYRFGVDDENVRVDNTLEDANLLISFKTFNMDCQYGLDGLVFDKQGNLYVGNFGDGTLHKITFDANGEVDTAGVFADSECMRTTDGICIDDAGNIYVADFSENAVCKVEPDGNVTVLARSGDCDGSKGGLDQPGEPIVWGDKLVVTCFDMVTGPDKVNTGHDKPYTIAYIDMDAVK
jgi:sugar lactone lactonase YvrE